MHTLVEADPARDEDDAVQGIVLLRKGEESLPALKDVKALIDSLNNSPGRLLPGVKIAPYYDRTRLINTTTETVRENRALAEAAAAPAAEPEPTS